MKLKKLVNVVLLGISIVVFFPLDITEANTSTKASPKLKRWERKVAETIKNYMWTHGEKEVWFHKPGERPYKFTITTEFLEDQVVIDFDAARFHKSWGPRALVTLKILCWQYGETRYDRYAINLNKNGTLDRGLNQINDCHMVSPDKDGKKPSDYILFCKAQGLTPDPKWIWSPYFNTIWAVKINESAAERGNDTYKYYRDDSLDKKGSSQQDIYDALLKVTGLRDTALIYNDGQFFDRPNTNKYASSKKTSVNRLQ